MGTLLDYRYSTETDPSVPHIHFGLWTVADGDICATSDGTRTPVELVGKYEVDGQAFETGQGPQAAR